MRAQKPASSRFRFLGASEDGKTLIWESIGPIEGDSRHVEITAPRAWFWRNQ